MKDNRAPVMVDVLYGIESFLLVFAALVPFIFRRQEDPILLCMRLLPAAVLYIIVVLITRLVRQPALRLALPFAAAVACVLTGRTTVEYVLLTIFGVFSVVCGFVIHFRMHRGSQRYNNMLLAIPVLAVMSIILSKFEMHDAAACVCLIMAIFLPIFIAVWYLNRFADSMSIFTMRTDQPIDRISKRMYKTIGTAVLLILFIALLVPQSNGVSFLVSLIEIGIAGIISLFIFIAGLIPVSESETLADEFGSVYAQPLDMGEESVWDVYLLYALAAIILIILIVFAVSSLIKLLKYLFSGFIQHDVKPAPENSGSDTIEKIAHRGEKRTVERLGRTNAGKIRRIYKKRVASILGKSAEHLKSLTPSEILVLCRRKGEDISELTALYKKARYTNSCTEDDLKKAKQL